MNAADAEEYTQALEQSHTGGWRLTLLAVQLGVPEALGLTTDQWRQRLGGHVREAIPVRREAVVELTAEPEDGGLGLSNRRAAEILGVDEKTIRNDLAAESSAPELESEVKPQVDEASPQITAEDSAPEPSEAVTEFLESDEDLQRARYLHEFLKALTRSDDFMEFEPEKLAELADTDVAQTVDDYAIRVRNFTERFHRARPGLQILNGGRT
jgi:hypothetical protein